MLPDRAGQQAAGAESPQSSPATAVLQPPTTVMGGGGAPKHIQIMKLDGQHIDHPREPPEIVYSGGDSPNSFCFHITYPLGKLFSGRYTHSIFL